MREPSLCRNMVRLSGLTLISQVSTALSIQREIKIMIGRTSGDNKIS